MYYYLRIFQQHELLEGFGEEVFEFTEEVKAKTKEVVLSTAEPIKLFHTDTNNNTLHLSMEKNNAHEPFQNKQTKASVPRMGICTNINTVFSTIN